MVLLSNTAAQTIAPGQTLTFDKLILKTGNGECCHNNAARTLTYAKLRQNGNYEIQFHANIGVLTTVGQIELTIAIDGIPLHETRMDSTPAGTGQYASVSSFAVVHNPCHETGIVTVKNTGTIDVQVATDPELLIRRIS